MLDTETKRRIDTCRNILVGKVPDPKSQVEQITIALIYKFMDDMDAEAEELGGKRSFFAGEFGKFGWAKLMAPNMGGFDILTLYSEAIQKMNENPGIPPLFRDIFKNAYLPYRDPETLRIFLKEINGFNYDHSEKLGDAFEYLLSVLGSQGDAGQFRTPRHIIDFMVEVINPQKNETILDPACGTAGFLISSFKHILKNNAKTRPGDKLTPDERTRLAKNIHGYDISPDMVRLSLVNLYLHGFTNPRIEEYDTLTSEDKWNDYADVIMANPPFMSPKGGIKPHKRFSVQSKRSEVLFVDYMAEHLTPTGRAAIIVPEGIIFQSQTAYKQLRKMLVDTSLVALVSLPAGVFNPYSGVKTSILILDKPLAKKSDSIAFIKIENDGYGLGAQRREIDKNDLPPAADFLKTWLQSLRSPSSIPSTASILSIPNALIVEKTKIAANGDYNLSGERYQDETVCLNRKWPMVELGMLFETKSGTTPSRINAAYFTNGTIPWVKTLDLTDGAITTTHENITQLALDETHLSILPIGTVLIAMYGGFNQIGRTGVLEIRATHNQAMTALLPTPKVSPYFLNAILTISKDYWKTVANSTRKDPNITKGDVLKVKIPLPPIATQQAIVEEIEGYQKVIDGARAVLDSYRPHIPIHPDWPLTPIGELAGSIFLGLVRNKAEQDPRHAIPYIKMNNITSDGALDLSELVYVNATKDELSRYSLSDGDFIYNTRNAPDLVGKSAVFHGESERYLFNNNILRIRFGPRALPDYVNTVMNSNFGKAKIRAQVDGTTSVAALYQKNYMAIEIPLPPIETQQQIVAEIEAEQALVAANRELIERFEKKIQTTIARVWGEAVN